MLLVSVGLMVLLVHVGLMVHVRQLLLSYECALIWIVQVCSVVSYIAWILTMKGFVVLNLILLCFRLSCGIQVPPEWMSYLVMVTMHFES